MEVNLSNIERFKVVEMKKIGKQRGQTLRKGFTMLDFQVIPLAYEEVHMKEISTQEQEGDNPDDDEEEHEEEEENYLVASPESNPDVPTGMRSPTVSVAGPCFLCQPDTIRRQAERDLGLQLAKLKLVVKEKRTPTEKIRC
ncbi:hypothetical protein NDU88_005902 [Pleurodeles waltl]|uniref:Uncharacterized protein n=1 Tax=Pleurodeles waltl TaxID=8319 RepID=A0AAV7QGD9_PLEWA|nr:hypothetical protein NDU88_005902 [Pleurodeles waltl]